MKTKALSVLLALVLTLAACGATSPAAGTEAAEPFDERETVTLSAETSGFSDVPADADYAQAGDWRREKDILNGVGSDRFDPEGTLTRAMLVTALYRAAGMPAISGVPSFADTQTNTWYSAAVVWAGENGLAQGYGNGLFGTNDPVSVEQLDVILGRYTGNGPEWTGDPARAHAATRAQVATALYNALSGGDKEPAEETGKVLVAYFPATGTTRPLAEYAAEILDADLFGIVPAQPYTSADLNYNTDCRANREQNDDSARPAIAADCVVEDMDAYDVVFLGYPIWWGVPPKIMRTFVENYDLSEKAIVPFCTSGSSGFSDEGLTELAPGANWLPGRRFAAGTSKETVAEWIDTLELPKQEETDMKQIVLSFNGHTYPATLADNSSAEAFVELLKGGPLTVSAHDYGSFEKVGDLGTTLPRNDEKITTSPGDIILYQGNQITVYYAQNSWNFTRLGRIDDPTGLREALGGGNVEITFQLADSGEDAGPFDLAAGQVTLNSGYVMPINGLGTYSLHGDECVNAVKAALKSGVRLFDTASAYGNEEEVGRAIREGMEELGIQREEIFVITKIYPGGEMADPETSIQACLDRLDLGYVDMMLLHHPDPNDVKAYKAMEKFVEDGKIHSLGLSNWYVKELESFLPQVTIKPALVQNEIHPYYQENDVIPYIQEQGITVQGWYPLGGRGHTAELLGDETISAIAKAHGVSSAQVILRWNLQKGVVVIPGSGNPDHIQENTELYHFELTEAEMEQINALDRNEKHDWY